MGGDASLLWLNFNVLLALSSQLSVFSKLCIMNTPLHFLLPYVSHAVVSVTYLWWPAYPLPSIDQKVLSRLAEYGEVIRWPPFKPCLGPRQP